MQVYISNGAVIEELKGMRVIHTPHHIIVQYYNQTYQFQKIDILTKTEQSFLITK